MRYKAKTMHNNRYSFNCVIGDLCLTHFIIFKENRKKGFERVDN